VPRPEFYGYCDDPSVTGAKFYLMEHIDGFVVGRPDATPPAFRDRKSKDFHDLAFALLSGSVKLHQVDHAAVGLADFGKTENFLERQVDRWLGQLEVYKQADGYEGRVIPGMAYVADWLRHNRPESRYFGIIHGDYSFANSMYHKAPPARLAAMIDWELATVGDTMLDLGSVLYGFKGRSDTTPAVGFFGPDDFPDRETLAEFYAEGTGRSIENLNYYIVLAIFKLAAIMEGQVARGLAGKQDPSRVQYNIGFVDGITAKAEALVRAAG
jgi:aminoglycoside phosphotransferase (APT) family kinase protein